MSSTGVAAKNVAGWSANMAQIRPSTNVFIVVGRGAVFIEGPVSAEKLGSYGIDDALSNFRPAAQQHKALQDIAMLQDGYVFIIRSGQNIVGYVTFCPPDEYLKWGNDQIPGLLELGAIEISPNWRREGLGIKLLREVFSTGIFEDYLIISMEYYWHWDVDKSELSIWEYRNMLANVFSGFGFELWETDDPEVRSHPANTFMVKAGRRIPSEWIDRMHTVATTRRQTLGDNW